MYQRLSLRILLGLLAFSSFSITAGAEIDFDKENYSPLSHTYTHDLLKSVSKFHSRVDDVPFGVSHFIKGLQINQDNEGNITNVDFLLPLPFMVLNVGLDLKPNMEQNFGFSEDELLNILRGNVTLGHLYKYPFYVRVGYDYVPFGRHFSEAITPYRMVTKSIMENKGGTLSGGGSYKASQGEFQGSISVTVFNKSAPPKKQSAPPKKQRIPRDFEDELQGFSSYASFEESAPIPEETALKGGEEGVLVSLKGQYDHMREMQVPRLGAIERSLVGGGIGITDQWDVLFNCYSHINFSKSYNFLFEYVYNARAFLFTDWRKQALAHALHIEGSKNFPSVTIMRWQPSPTVIGGFECGSKLLQESPITVSNLFVAGKLAFWKKRFTLLGGARVNLTHGLQPFGRISLSL